MLKPCCYRCRNEVQQSLVIVCRCKCDSTPPPTYHLHQLTNVTHWADLDHPIWGYYIGALKVSMIPCMWRYASPQPRTCPHISRMAAFMPSSIPSTASINRCLHFMITPLKQTLPSFYIWNMLWSPEIWSKNACFTTQSFWSCSLQSFNVVRN